MSGELKQILEKLGERDITKIYFMKAILIENNTKEKRKESKYMKTFLSVQGSWKSSLVLVPNIILFHVQLYIPWNSFFLITSKILNWTRFTVSAYSVGNATAALTVGSLK